MPLNYSKWDKLELSDDSDIEGHPNVDHKSLVRWKQRDIHEKRAERNMKIEGLKAEISCNDVLLPKIKAIADQVAKEGPHTFSNTVERLKTNPSPEGPETKAARKVSYDEMVLSLLLQVWEEAKASGAAKKDTDLGDVLVKGLRKHVTNLGEVQTKLREDLNALEEEKKKKITTDDIHEGWESKYVPPTPDPEPIKNAIPSSKGKGKSTTIEVLNPKSSFTAPEKETVEYDSDAALPQMTPGLEIFAKIRLKQYEESYQCIQQHRDVYVSGASDALLVAAFTAEGEGKHSYAKQCVNASLLLQYCEKLGPDGPRTFFRRMIAGDARAHAVFEKDLDDTYNHLVTRVKVTKEEEAANEGEEQIQLVPENPDSVISFIIPDGPPPADLRLEGPGTENLDIEQVRAALQMRWDVFESFSPELQEALKSQTLASVNAVLGKMSVPEAESVVALLDKTGILNFAGSKDETGGDADADDEGEEGDEEVDIADTVD